LLAYLNDRIDGLRERKGRAATDANRHQQSFKSSRRHGVDTSSQEQIGVIVPDEASPSLKLNQWRCYSY
jgi:hypothetical protein